MLVERAEQSGDGAAQFAKGEHDDEQGTAPKRREEIAHGRCALRWFVGRMPLATTAAGSLKS
jgi:hypothetical protein